MAATDTTTPTAQPQAAPAPSAGAPASPPPRELTNEELNAIRENIRMERAKLQTKLQSADELQQQVASLTSQNATLTSEVASAKAETQKVTADLETLQHSVTAEDGNVDVAKLIREVSENAEKRFEKANEDRIAALERNQQSMQAENARLRVESYRERRIREEREKGTQMIAELVTGGSESEVESALQGAIAKYQEYFGSQPAAAPAVPAALAPGAAPTASAPVAPGAAPTTPAQGVAPVRGPVETSGQAHATPSPAAGTGEGLQGIMHGLVGKKGQKAFAENREALLEAAAQEHSAIAGSNMVTGT